MSMTFLTHGLNNPVDRLVMQKKYFSLLPVSSVIKSGFY